MYDALATRMATQRSSTERGSSLRNEEHLKGLNGNLMNLGITVAKMLRVP